MPMRVQHLWLRADQRSAVAELSAQPSVHQLVRVHVIPSGITVGRSSISMLIQASVKQATAGQSGHQMTNVPYARARRSRHRPWTRTFRHRAG
jgi:hypothetical protein